MPDLYSLLTAPGEVKFFFKTGMAKALQLKTHQLPMKETYLARHRPALHDVRFIYYKSDGVTYLTVSARTQNQLERHEYMVKRAILDLKERYGWEVD